MAARRLKLSIELVPQTCWYSNLREKIPEYKWKKLREQVIAKANNVCEICGNGGRLYCHEVWEYNDRKRIQRLVGFVALCELCHLVKHIGRSSILASRGKLDFDAVVRHFRNINKVSLEEFEKHKTEAFKQWRKRSHYQWRTELGKFVELVHGEKSNLKFLMYRYSPIARKSPNVPKRVHPQEA